MLDKENSELVAEVFEKNGTSDEYLTEIRMPISLGIVGHVAQTGQMMNVKDVYKLVFWTNCVHEELACHIASNSLKSSTFIKTNRNVENN